LADDSTPHDQAGAHRGKAGSGSRSGIDADQCPRSPRSHDDLNFVDAGPGGVNGTGGCNFGSANEAVVDVLQLMGAVAPKAQVPVVIGGQAHPGAPAQTVFVRSNRLDLNLSLDPGQTFELLRNAICLECALARQAHVLKVAATASTGPGEWARWSDPVG